MADNANRTLPRTETERARQQNDDVTDTIVRTVKSATDDGARVVREAAEQVSRAAGSAASTGAQIADETTRVAGEMNDRATELTLQSIETIQKGVENSLEIGSRMTARSMNLFVDAAGIPSEDTKEATDHSLQNIRAMIDSGNVLMNSFQEAAREWLDRSRARMKGDMDALEAVFRSRTVTEFTEAQTSLARRQFEGFITEGQHATELVGKAAATALRKIKVREIAR